MPDVDRSHDAVIVTHRHPDHFDDAAKAELDPDVPLFCQPTEADAFVDEGFTDVRPVEDAASFAGVTLHRTPGRHGHGERAERMGPVSGFVLEGDETLYLAGDTVWYEPVAETLARFEPDAVVLNGGAARFNEGGADHHGRRRRRRRPRGHRRRDRRGPHGGDQPLSALARGVTVGDRGRAGPGRRGEIEL